MDLNLIVLAGRLAADPEVTTFASGSTLWRGLITVRSTEPRRRIDVIPIVMWDPTDELMDLELVRGDGVWAVGSVQRRFWSAEAGRTSRIEVVCYQVTRKVEMSTRELSDGDMAGAIDAQADADAELASNE